MSDEKWLVGTVYWFDELSNEGMIRGNDGSLYYVHGSAILTPSGSLTDGENIVFQLLPDKGLRQVFVII